MLNLQMAADALLLFQSSSRACHGLPNRALLNLLRPQVCIPFPSAPQLQPQFRRSSHRLRSFRPTAVLICKPVGTTTESVIASMKSLARSRSRNEKLSVCKL